MGTECILSKHVMGHDYHPCTNNVDRGDQLPPRGSIGPIRVNRPGLICCTAQPTGAGTRCVISRFNLPSITFGEDDGRSMPLGGGRVDVYVAQVSAKHEKSSSCTTRTEWELAKWRVSVRSCNAETCLHGGCWREKKRRKAQGQEEARAIGKGLENRPAYGQHHEAVHVHDPGLVEGEEWEPDPEGYQFVILPWSQNWGCRAEWCREVNIAEDHGWRGYRIWR
mmetsp:Transcript_11885/g.21838  ORF Transcript_11885/g.21838 Transcript_11885/m.21838 type:complete len:223 (+) Transcript_11885:77-745(+)